MSTETTFRRSRPADAGLTCWQCREPAQREKAGFGACTRHLLPNREQRRSMGATSASAAPRQARQDGHQHASVAPAASQPVTGTRSASRASQQAHKPQANPRPTPNRRVSDLATVAQFQGRKLSTAVLRYPSGRYGIVGSVPAELAGRAWDTEQEVIDALLAIGVTRFQRDDCSWYVAPEPVATTRPTEPAAQPSGPKPNKDGIVDRYSEVCTGDYVPWCSTDSRDDAHDRLCTKAQFDATERRSRVLRVAGPLRDGEVLHCMRRLCLPADDAHTKIVTKYAGGLPLKRTGPNTSHLELPRSAIPAGLLSKWLAEYHARLTARKDAAHA